VGSIPSTRVVLYTGAGCSLCDAAVEVVRAVCGESFRVRPIDGDAELEARYRSWLPVLEVDGERVFTYFVEPDALRRRLEHR
jgi:Glutaredoxin-like domain (DUF836)